MAELKLKKPKETDSIVEFFSMLLNSSTQAHIFHFQTKSYAAHAALGSYYEEVVGLADELIEAYQGKYGIVTGYSSYAMKDLKDTESAIEFLNSVHTKAESIAFSDSDLKNKVDEIKSLIKTTLYKLKNLK